MDVRNGLGLLGYHPLTSRKKGAEARTADYPESLLTYVGSTVCDELV
jgi:hypothetical protein